MFSLPGGKGGDEVCNLIIFIQNRLTSMPFIVLIDDYSRTTDKVFEKASRYEDRKQEKDKSHEKKSVLEKLEEKKDEAKATIGAKKTSYRDAVSL